MATQNYVTDSDEALAAAEVEGADVWIHGKVTYITLPDTETDEQEVEAAPKAARKTKAK